MIIIIEKISSSAGRQPGGRLQGGLQLAAGLAGCPQQLCQDDSREGGCRAGCSWPQALQAALSSSDGTTARRGAGGGAAAGSRPCRLPSAALPGRQPGGRLEGGLQLAAGLAGCPQQLCRDDSQEGGCSRAGCSWQQALQGCPQQLCQDDSQEGGWRGGCSWQQALQAALSSSAGTTSRRGAAGRAAAGSRPCRLPSAALPGRHPGGRLQGGLQLAAGLAGCPQQLCRDDIQEGGCREGCSWQQALHAALSSSAGTTSRRAAGGGAAAGSRPCRLPSVALPGRYPGGGLQGGLQLAAGLAGCPQQLCRDDSKEGGLQGVLQLAVGPGAIARRGAAAGGRPCRLHTAALRRGQYKRGPEGRGAAVGSSPYRLVRAWGSWVH